MNLASRTTLGRTGLSVSRLGIGSGYGIKGAGIEKAYHEHGVNYFYWSTPRRSGMREGLRNLVKEHRDDVVIVLQSYDHLGISVRRSVGKGLRALNIDYADVLLLGWHNWQPPQRVVDGALEMKERGLVRHLAMSGHNRRFFGKLAQQADSPIDIFMIRYNAAHPGAEQDIFPHLPSVNRPGITTYTATSWGKLLNSKKMPPGEQPMTAAECYRFALSNSHVDLCMMGPSNEQELEQGLQALRQGPLSDAEMDRVRKIGTHVHG